MGNIVVILAIIAIGVFVLLLIAGAIGERNAATLAERNADLITRFGEGDYHLALPGPRCLGIVWDSESLILGDDVVGAVAIPLADIRDANIEIDGVEVTTSRSTTSTNRGSQLAGGLIGGALLGPAGVVIGGLSGSNTTTGKSVGERKVKSVKLVIRIADRTAPLRTYVFYQGYGEGHEASSLAVKPSLDKAAHFHALLTQVIEDRAVNGPAAADRMAQA